MKRRKFLQTSLSAAGAASVGAGAAFAKEKKPNIVLIVADDLGYNELGCYGQQKIQTPNLDAMAAEGMQFTQFYSGQAVCAPCRCTLMTGKHQGHAFIRSNKEVKPEGQHPIPAASWTIGKMLKEQGYATAAIGKWGLGPVGSSGDPNKQGFDLFFGYNCQRHAHNYYPRYLYRNKVKVKLPGNDRGLTGKHYAPDLMIEEALGFIKEHQEEPFFLFYPTPVPHLALQVPEDSLAEYKGKWDDPPYDGKTGGYLPHPNPKACYAGMITRMDRDIGRIMGQLKDLGLDENTLVIFSSDNGPTFLDGPDTDFFDSNGPLRGKKGQLYEGGIRVPTIARWPGKIPAGTVSDHVGAFWDMLPTLAEASGGKIKGETDGISFLPALLGKPGQKKHAYLYWEFPGYGGQQAIRMGDWKAIRRHLRRKKGDRSFQLYNLKNDIGETQDVADRHPAIMKKMREIAQEAREP
ncbi:sulfatase-like hydrolase/transferase, partial [bacterium]|nr:sulfatase-like hydrolase/transferase [bacterium]